MGKKSRGKRERRAEIGANRLADRAAHLSELLAEGTHKDDPTMIRRLAEEMGPAWLMTKISTKISGKPFPFAASLALAKAPKCLAALIEETAPRAREAANVDPHTAETASIAKSFAESVQSLSFLAATCERDGEPHPSEPIRRALGSLFDWFPDDILEVYEARLHPLVRDDWSFVERNRLAGEESEALLGAIGDAGIPKAGEPEREKQPGGL